MKEIFIKEHIVLVDDEDYPELIKHKWRLDGRSAKRGFIYFRTTLHSIDNNEIDMPMHRFIMKCHVNDGIVVDHINHNTLDNRKENLRKATKGENSRNGKRSKTNITGYKGVVQFAPGKYKACIQHIKSMHIGQSDDPIECAKMYDMIAIKLFGEFACTNFPKETYKNDDIDVFYDKFKMDMYSNNTSGYRGVTHTKEKKPWLSGIRYNNQRINLGYFADPVSAAKAYDKKAIELLGDKAKTNFNKEMYGSN